TITVDISQVLADTELDPLDDHQKTQVLTENKTVKFSPLLPIFLVLIVGLGLISGLLLANKLKQQFIKSEPPTTSSPTTPASQVQTEEGTGNKEQGTGKK
ncbi:MAG: hypothetical protein AN487_23470, partial [Anabaena sp. CRKS33]